jgi:hypothetical protein
MMALNEILNSEYDQIGNRYFIITVNNGDQFTFDHTNGKVYRLNRVSKLNEEV